MKQGDNMKLNQVTSKELNDFIKYVRSFYFDNDAIYPLKHDGIYSHDIVNQCCEFASKSQYFRGDSVDREVVRGMLENIGFKEERIDFE